MPRPKKGAPGVPQETATLAHGIGDVVLLGDPAAPAGFALCHVGPGTEAGSNTCYAKFGAVACAVGYHDMLAAKEGEDLVRVFA